jgi:hypothetical protein
MTGLTMAYYLTGCRAFQHARQHSLRPLRSDQGINKISGRDPVAVKNAIGAKLTIPPQTKYRITGTRDGNGYVVTFDNIDLGTQYFEAQDGVNLV